MAEGTENQRFTVKVYQGPQRCGCSPESRRLATPWPMPEFNDCIMEYFVVLIRQGGVLRHDACGKAWPEEALQEQES